MVRDLIPIAQILVKLLKRYEVGETNTEIKTEILL